MSLLPRISTRLALFIALALLAPLAACGPTATPLAPRTPAPASPGAVAPGGSGGGRAVLAEATPGVRLRLADAVSDGAATAEGIPEAATSPLDGAETAALLARLPVLPESAALRASFSLRPGPKPPALTGNTIQAAWPPAATPASTRPEVGTGGPLQVLRVSPEGDVAIAPNLSVTFNQPMVPLASIAELAAKDVPVRLSPAVPGSWRWLGTRTVVFEPAAGRLPMATAFAAEVPAGTKSANGGTLAAAKTWRFQTPPATIVGLVPADGSESVVREPVLFAEFDQAVEAQAVRAKTAARAAGQAISLRLATDAEVAADEAAATRQKQAVAGRWVALKPERPLALGVKVEVAFGPGLPSVEGPRVSDATEKFGFSVYGPLRVTRLECNGAARSVEAGGFFGGSIDQCDPQSLAFSINLSNGLDLDAFTPEAIKVEPLLTGQQVMAYDRSIVITGRAVGRTSYAVTLPADLGDTFGQTLGQNATLTFETGDAEPLLAGPPDRMVVLDPAAGGQFRLWSVNNASLDVTLYRVRPSDWRAFQEYQSGLSYRSDERQPQSPPGQEVWRGQVAPGGERDALVNVPIDLAPALQNGFGQVVVLAEPPGWKPDDNKYQNRPVAHWVQVTQLAIDAFAGVDAGVVWVNRLADGGPVAGARVTLSPPGGSAVLGTGTTNSGGMTEITALDALEDEARYEQLIVATSGDDLAFEPGGVINAMGTPYDVGHVFTDRGIYQPGEEVHFKGWARRREGTHTRQLAALDAATVRGLRYGLWRQLDNTEVVSGTLALSAAGGYDAALTLGKDVAPGDYRLDINLAPAEGGADLATIASAALRVAEFRRPEFEVRATSQQPFVFVGDANTIDATASYYSGGGLGGSDVNWQVAAQATQYSPPGNDDYVFGEWRPWYYAGGDLGFQGVAVRSKGVAGGGISPGFGGVSATEVHTGRTNAEGRHHLAVTVEGVSPLSAVAVDARATVQDVNRQAWSGSASYLVHPAQVYVGLKPSQWFANAGEAFSIAAIAAELEGRRLDGVPIRVTIERLGWELKQGVYEETTTASGSCALSAKAGDDPAVCRWTPAEGGRYRVTADIADPDGRPNRTRLEVWVAGGEQPRSQSVEQGRVTLIPSQKEYRPGDTAEVLIQAPFAPAEGLVSIVRDGLVRYERITLKDGSLAYRLPITADDIPNVHLQVDVVGADYYPGAEQDPRGAALPKRPAYASGDVSLGVPPRVRTLAVEASPAISETTPGAEVDVAVRVRDADGQPVSGAEVVLAVVDEAVLALTGYQLPDPLATFYPERGGGLASLHSRGHVQLAEPDTAGGEVSSGGRGGGMGRATGAMDMAESVAMSAMPVPMSDGLAAAQKNAAGEDTGGDAGSPVRERVDLNPLAAFYPALQTDAEGRVSAKVKLPDNVTRYRVMAVATDGALRFGKGESALTARLPLAVRPSAPRFLNYGDAFALPVVIQNQTDRDIEAAVVVRAVNLKLGDPGGKRVRVPAQNRVEVRFPAAADQVGTAVFQVGAFAGIGGAAAAAGSGAPGATTGGSASAAGAGGETADAQRVTVPVYTPATTEAFATYGEVDEGGVVQPLQRPADAAPEFGGLELTTTSTAVGQLADAFIYLHDYPFDCAEQVASRLMTTVALGEVLAAFKVAELPSKEDVDTAIQNDTARLWAFDAGDGFSWWRGMRADPFVTVHVAHALALALGRSPAARDGGSQAGERYQQLARYLSGIDRLLDAAEIPAGEGRRQIKAHALAVQRLLSSDPEAVAGTFSEAMTILNASGERDTETLGWLLQALAGAPAPNDVVDAVAEIQRQLSNRVAEEAGKAVFRTSVREADRHFLLASDSRSTAVAVAGLMTADPESDLVPKVARGLLAARIRGRWATTQENAYVLVALGDYFRRYEGETPDFVARAWLGDGFLGESAFRGRTADRVDLQVPMDQLAAGGPQPLTLAKDGSGRLYYRLGLKYAPKSLELAPLDQGFSVARRYEAVDDPRDVVQTADGTWQVRAGSRVRVRLAVVAESERHHVALVDPLPAGFEAIDPELAVSQAPPPAEDEQPMPLERGPGGAVGSDAMVSQAPEAGLFTIPGWEWWWSHQALRHERAEVFAVRLPAGVYAYSYFARATTPGTFVAPPPRAEEMYAPETFGRGASNRVVIK